MKPLLVILAMVLASCTPPTPAEHVRNLRIEVEVVRVGCKVYRLRTDFPRDPVLDRDCKSLTEPAP